MKFLAFVCCGVWLFCAPLLGEVPPEDMPDFTPPFSLLSAYDGSPLIIDERQINWTLREIEDRRLVQQLRALDPWFSFRLSYVQFVRPDNKDVCLSISESGKFVGKSCEEDLTSGKFESVFSIIPTTTSAVQIRSMVLRADECITFFENPRGFGFGLDYCDVDRLFNVGLHNLMLIMPPYGEATPINP